MCHDVMHSLFPLGFNSSLDFVWQALPRSIVTFSLFSLRLWDQRDQGEEARETRETRERTERDQRDLRETRA